LDLKWHARLRKELDIQGEFSHFQYTVPKTLFEDANRDAIIRFFEEIFGWKARGNEDTMFFSAFRPGQCFVLKAGDKGTGFLDGDHIGIAVATEADYRAIHEKAATFAATDPRLEVTEIEEFARGESSMRFYFLKYLLPTPIEVQYHQPDSEFGG
jgi:hypothetical protein